MKLTYVTGNYGKFMEVKESFEKENLLIDYATLDIEEPDVNDINYIAKEKAKKAYEIIKSPVFVSDSGFFINNYPNHPGYPGAFVKRSGVANNIEELLQVMKDVKDRSCYFLDCITYYDGIEYKQFFEKVSGTLALEKKGNNLKKAKSNLWYVFIPNGTNKTLVEMEDKERKEARDGNICALSEFIAYIKKLKNKEE